MFELGPYNNINQNYAKGPRTLQLKLEKSSYLRYTLQLFSPLQQFLQQFYIWVTIFTTIF